MEDDVPHAEKVSRRQRIDALQESILTEVNGELAGAEFEVLVEARNKGKWQGRTRSNKLVFFPIAEDDGDRLGHLVNVRVERAGPWSLQGQPT
jgi:tRNA-2-methylthio-N6-dimethylallyladenosine synthase